MKDVAAVFEMLTAARVAVSIVQYLIGLQIEQVASTGAGLKGLIVDAVLDLRACSGLDVDEMDIRRRPANRALHRVRRPVDRIGQPLTAEGCDAFEEIGAERDEPVGVDVPGGQGVALAIGARVDLLARHDVDVARVPDLDGGWFLGFLLVFFLFLVGRARRAVVVGLVAVLGSRLRLLVPSRHADEHGPAVVGPRRAAEGHDARTGGEAGRRGRVVTYHLAERRPGEEHLRRPFVAVVGRAAQDGQVVGVLAPGEAAIDRGCRVEDPQRSRFGVVELDAVPGLVVGADGEREQGALLLPGELGHVAERRVLAGCEMPNDERRADWGFLGRR